MRRLHVLGLYIYNAVSCHQLRSRASLLLTATGLDNGNGRYSIPYRIDTP